MSAGREALAEAARLETARIYSRTLEQQRREHETPGVSIDEYDRIVDERRAGNVIALRRRSA